MDENKNILTVFKIQTNPSTPDGKFKFLCLIPVPQGESVITRDSVETTGNEWTTSYQVWDQAEKAFQGKAPFYVNQADSMHKLAQHLLLPKGTFNRY